MFLVVTIILRNEYISFRHSSPNEETVKNKHAAGTTSA